MASQKMQFFATKYCYLINRQTDKQKNRDIEKQNIQFGTVPIDLYLKFRT